MKSISKLKDDARKHELREEWEKAVQVYLQVLKVGDEGEGEVELPLYNRVGDLHVRLGRAQEAVKYYEQAADKYADAGLYNNAIALCNKAMRYQPHQLGLLRKLGMFSAQQGFYADARRFFVEYADKQIAQGKVEDALKALEEFARIADDADSRELLGRRLHERGRTAEAVAALRTAHVLRIRSGQTEEAEALRKEIRSIDPSARFEQDEQRQRPASGSYEPGVSQLDTDPFGGADDRSRSESVPLDDSGTDYGLVDIGGLDDFELAGSHDAGAFDDASPTGIADDAFADLDADDAFDLPLLADSEDEATGFGIRSPGTRSGGGRDQAQTPGGRSDELAEFDDFDAGAEDLPLLDDDAPSQLHGGDADEQAPADLDFDSFGEVDGLSAEWPDLSAAEPTEAGAGFDEFLDRPSSSDDVGGGDFAGWPEDPDADLNALLLPEEHTPSYAASVPGPNDTTLLDVDLPDVGGWDEQDQDESAAVEEMALEAAAVTERAMREAEEAERREAEEAARREAEEAAQREAEEAARREAEALAAAAAREAEARAAAVREAEARAAAAREAAAREAEAREATARQAAAREAEAREAASREAATREAEAREAREKAAAREAAVRDPWAPDSRTAQRPAAEPRAGPPNPDATPARPAPARRDDNYVDLGSLFAEDDTESTRFRIQESLPTGDEDEDFAELLSRFKEKVAEHLPPEDAAAHYDLGLAFKEMGLIDEAIAEFQVALRTGHMRLKVYEELGYCFLHKQQYNIAEKVLRQALQLEHRHELELLGIYYQLGRAYEAMGRLEQARDAYERVLGMDLHFQDTSERLARL
jgi:tetratricopeptide (TPR) repeat protein